MVLGKICPFCHIEHAPDVELCERCGRPLSGHSSKLITTKKVSNQEPGKTKFLPSVKHLGDLSKNTLVLFVSDEDEPIVLEDVQEIVLGRPVTDSPTERTFDLTNYGAVTLGVSRRHVQITYTDGTFKVIDLDSTNGTLLNGRVLPPARSRQLQPFDQLTLGQLQLMVYFEVKPGEEGKNLLLTDRRATQSWSLTPQYLTSTIIPYIQALADIQGIIHEVHGQPIDDIQVIYIQSGERPAQVRLRLMMTHESIDIVRQWIGPWQRIYADPNLSTANPNDKELLPKLQDLVSVVADNLTISFSDLEADSVREKLLAPISLIAMSGLELILENQQT